MPKKQKSTRGSVLVFSLVILTIMLSAALSILSISILEKKSSLSTGKSVQSFNVAQSGVERVLQAVYKDQSLTDLSSLASNAAVNGTCLNGKITVNSVAGGNVELTFKNGSDVDISACSGNVFDIASVRSLGTAFGTSRAVETAVAAPCYGPQLWGGGYVTRYSHSYFVDNSSLSGASSASLACGVTGPPSPAPGQLNVRFYMHNTYGCLVGFNVPIVITVPFSGYSNVWTCGGTTTYLESATCAANDCEIISTVQLGAAVYQRYKSVVPRPSGL